MKTHDDNTFTVSVQDCNISIDGVDTFSIANGTLLSAGYVGVDGIDPALIARIEKIEKMMNQLYYPMRREE